MRERRRRGRSWPTSRAGWLKSPHMRLASVCARRTLIPSVIVLAAAAARAQSERWLLTRFVEHEVAVEIALERDRAGKMWLGGAYTPSRAGVYLYGEDLPKAGDRGGARPPPLGLASAPFQQ